MDERWERELAYWIERVHGLGRAARDAGDYFAEAAADATARLDRCRAALPGLQAFDTGVWVEVECGPYPTLLQAPPGATVLMLSPLMKQYFRQRLVPDDVAAVHGRVFIEGSVVEIPLPDECADIVLCPNFLQVGCPPAAGLRELVRILRLGGHLVLELDSSGRPDQTVLTRLAPDEIVDTAASLGLTELNDWRRPAIGDERTDAMFFQRVARGATPPIGGAADVATASSSEEAAGVAADSAQPTTGNAGGYIRPRGFPGFRRATKSGG